MDIADLHPSVWSSLQGRRERLPHALLLMGRRGIGKFLLAKLFAESLLCERRTCDGRPCGNCQSCHWFEQGYHPDLRFILPESLERSLLPLVQESDEETQKKDSDGKPEKKASQQITVEQIRSLADFLSVGTHRQGLRIIVIYPAEAMNRNTANAILKSLEEPNPSTLFLLVSSEQESLLPTIRSRCQTVPVPLPGEDQSLAYLRHHGHDAQKIGNYLAWVGGSPFLAIELADQVSGGWLGTLLLEGLKRGRGLDVYGLAAQLDEVMKKERQQQGRGGRDVCEWLQRWTHDLSLAESGLPPRFFREEQQTMLSLVASLSSRALAHFYRHQLLALRRCADHPVNQRLFLETLLGQYKAMFFLA